jgi:hypothetical protein
MKVKETIDWFSEMDRYSKYDNLKYHIKTKFVRIGLRGHEKVHKVKKGYGYGARWYTN